MKANHNEELATSLIPEAVSNGSKIDKSWNLKKKQQLFFVLLAPIIK